jgi:uncharacterized protein (DUF1800 family)
MRLFYKRQFSWLIGATLSILLFGCGATGNTSVLSSTSATTSPSTPIYSADGSISVAYSPGQSVVIPASIAKSSLPLTELDAIRLAKQATFGPTKSLIDQIRTLGLQGWIEAQTQLASSGYPLDADRYIFADSSIFCTGTSEERGRCWRENYSAEPVQRQFIVNAITAPDQLRQRVAFALSQIFVISAQEINPTYAIANFQQMLANAAFGNFQDLLKAVCLHPTMGHYLDTVNSDKTNPNENFARELLQLFSIGLYELNTDGTNKLINGRPIATYDNEIVQGFAAALSGYVYPPLPGKSAQAGAPGNYLSPMASIASRHSTGPKKLLRGVTLPAGQSAEQDLNGVIANIAGHPNLAPFISKQLIQHLVTSNPTPEYVGRIAAVFNDNGKGIKGDLKATIAAILMDPEARGELKTHASYGRLQDPVLFSIQAMRALNTKTDGVFPIWRLAEMNQSIFSSPSVFNFYPPDYALPTSKTKLASPSFALINTNTNLARANFIHDLLHNEWIRNPTNFAGYKNGAGTQSSLEEWLALADDPTKLVEQLDLMLTAKRLPTAQKEKIITRLRSINQSDNLKRNIDRSRLGFYLVMTSPTAQIEK